LVLQIRQLKESEKDLIEELLTARCQVEERDEEIDRLEQAVGASNPDMSGAELTATQAKFQIMQQRNASLEKQLKSSILQEHEDFMSGKSRPERDPDMQTPMDVYCTGCREEFCTTFEDYCQQARRALLEVRLKQVCKEKMELYKKLKDCRKGGTTVDEDDER